MATPLPLPLCTLLLMAAGLVMTSGLPAQTLTPGNRQPPPAVPSAATVSQEGIPVTDPVVIAKCGSCHTRDANGIMQRISATRTTPEGWQDVLKQMIVQNNLSVTPAEARAIVKYLSASHGLAPAESQPVRNEAERRIYQPAGSSADRLLNACTKCHAITQPLSWRRSQAEWKEFGVAHAARYKFRPNEDVIALVAGLAPLHTPEWDTWSARRDTADFTGRWLAVASLPGRGPFFGELEVKKTGADEFSTIATLVSVRDGSRLTRTGRSAVYGRTAWRGRSAGPGSPSVASPSVASPSAASPLSEAREALWIAPDHTEAEGRWFWGQYQEFGFDVQLRRPAAGPSALLLDRTALKAGSHAERIRILGADFPARIEPADLKFGPGVTVQAVVSHTATEILAEVDVAADALPGKRSITFRDQTVPTPLTVYRRVDSIKVRPDSAMASFEDSGHPAGYRQFEAIGYQREGNLELGPVDVTWSVEAFHAAPGSNSDYLGVMSPEGLFSPALTTAHANFDAWVIATAKTEKDADGNPLQAKSYLTLMVPTYIFDGRRYVRDLDRWVDDGPAR